MTQFFLNIVKFSIWEMRFQIMNYINFELLSKLENMSEPFTITNLNKTLIFENK